MRTITLAILTTALMAASAAQGASAAQHRHAQNPAAASAQFRNANNAVTTPAQQRSWYSGGYSAPAGH